MDRDYYGYKVKWNKPGEQSPTISYGIISTENWSQAMAKIVSVYGEYKIEEVFIEAIEFDTATLEVSKELYYKIKGEFNE